MKDLVDLREEYPNTTLKDGLCQYIVKHDRFVHKLNQLHTGISASFAGLDEFNDMKAKYQMKIDAEILKNELR